MWLNLLLTYTDISLEWVKTIYRHFENRFYFKLQLRDGNAWMWNLSWKQQNCKSYFWYHWWKKKAEKCGECSLFLLQLYTWNCLVCIQQWARRITAPCSFIHEGFLSIIKARCYVTCALPHHLPSWMDAGFEEQFLLN